MEGKGKEFMNLTTTYPQGNTYDIDDPYHTNMQIHTLCEPESGTFISKCVSLSLMSSRATYIKLLVKHYHKIYFFNLQR